MADRAMKLIAITPENFIKDEITFITTILDSGFDYVHIRKPQSTIDEVRNFINMIPQIYHSRLKLHDYFELTAEFYVGGIHLNKRSSTIPIGKPNLKLSKSCHSLDELIRNKRYEYLFLSPIFDSISKSGYKSGFDLYDIADKLHCGKIVALGGIDASRMADVRDAGFAGVAFLGYLFFAKSVSELKERLNKINKNL